MLFVVVAGGFGCRGLDVLIFYVVCGCSLASGSLVGAMVEVFFFFFFFFFFVVVGERERGRIKNNKEIIFK